MRSDVQARVKNICSDRSTKMPNLTSILAGRAKLLYSFSYFIIEKNFVSKSCWLKNTERQINYKTKAEVNNATAKSSSHRIHFYLIAEPTDILNT